MGIRLAARCAVAQLMALVLVAPLAMAQVKPASRLVPPKDATIHTKKANEAWYDKLDWDNKDDLNDAQKGLIDRPEKLTIYGRVNEKITKVWDLEEYKKYINWNIDKAGLVDSVNKKAPPEINPSLYRNAQLNMQYGLFEVLKDKIYQVRGYDLANITFVKGNKDKDAKDDCWIVFDPLMFNRDRPGGLRSGEQESGHVPGEGGGLQPLPRRPLRWRARAVQESGRDGRRRGDRARGLH